jgi:hypothetical protein
MLRSITVFMIIAYRDKKVVGNLCAFSCTASNIQYMKKDLKTALDHLDT